MLGDFAASRTPLNLMMSEFKPQLRVAETVVLQSVHPFDNKASLRTITIPDAQALEIQLDEVTQMHDQVRQSRYS